MVNYFYKTGKTAAVCLTMLLLAGCYEGWQYGKGRGPGQDPDTPDEPAAKPISYILFETFQLDQVSVFDTKCFAFEGDRQFRITEWQERIAAAEEALKSIAEQVVTVNRYITPDDCQTLLMFSVFEFDSDPWAGQYPPVDDRNTIHLRAYLFASERDGDYIRRPLEWQAFRDLSADGYRTDSLEYFVVPVSENGFFGQMWNHRITSGESGYTSQASVILPPVGNMSSDDRRQLIKGDTTTLLNWVGGFR